MQGGAQAEGGAGRRPAAIEARGLAVELARGCAVVHLPLVQLCAHQLSGEPVALGTLAQHGLVVPGLGGSAQRGDPGSELLVLPAMRDRPHHLPESQAAHGEAQGHQDPGRHLALLPQRRHGLRARLARRSGHVLKEGLATVRRRPGRAPPASARRARAILRHERPPVPPVRAQVRQGKGQAPVWPCA